MAMTSTERVKRKQARARESGACIVCFKRSPAPGRIVCDQCNDAAKKRVHASRLRKVRATT